MRKLPPVSLLRRHIAYYDRGCHFRFFTKAVRITYNLNTIPLEVYGDMMLSFWSPIKNEFVSSLSVLTAFAGATDFLCKIVIPIAFVFFVLFKQ